MKSESQSVLDYISQLDKPVLDDRRFEDLLQECLLRIPRYCPEWTHHNASDPGITLIELFAWLVHQMLHRFNQVPKRHYIAFLELLGIRLQPPQPAQVGLTFYLTEARVHFQQNGPEDRASSLVNSSEPPYSRRPKVIPQGCEVATVRTETQESLVFTTVRDLVITQPTIKYLLFSQSIDPSNLSQEPDKNPLENVFGSYRREPSDHSDNFLAPISPQSVDLFRPCEPGSCFYLVLDELAPARSQPDEPITEQESDHVARPSNDTRSNSSNISELGGSVLSLTFAGRRVETTGLDPNNPPLRWQAWDGKRWQDNILRKQADDKTRGFSFDWASARPNGSQFPEADIILHLPEKCERASFGTSAYEGYWIRCVCLSNNESDQFDSIYHSPPEISAIKVKTIGGTVRAHECVKITNELIGISNGKPGQSFQLSHRPVLARAADEFIEVRPPSSVAEPWEEQEYFGDSLESDRHYTIDSQQGIVQFGPLIREPHHLRERTHAREQAEAWKQPVWVPRPAIAPESFFDNRPIPAVLEAIDRESERQYGRVPPAGSEIYMKAYKTGGGTLGNVQAEQLTVLKTAIPYVKQVTNHTAATKGKNADSIEAAMLRVPAILRTRETALTPEEFEKAARQFRDDHSPAEQTPYPVERAHCITKRHLTKPGEVRLLIVPKLPEQHPQTFEQGLHPRQLLLTFHESLQSYLDDRRALGIQVTTEMPSYVGISVHARIHLQPQYVNPSIDQDLIAAKISRHLYCFLNPLKGGVDGKGWPIGRSIEDSDIIAVLQQLPEVRAVANVTLYAIKKRFPNLPDRPNTEWTLLPTALKTVELSELEIATSWEADGMAHQIEFLNLHERSQQA